MIRYAVVGAGWISQEAIRNPINPEAAFIGFVRRYHAKNRHLLR